MINKLTKFATLAALTALTTVGCAKHETLLPPVVNANPPVVVRVPPKAVEHGWNIVNKGWTITSELALDMGDPEPQTLLELNKQVTEDVKAIAQIEGVALSKEGADSFYDDMREEATSRDPAVVKVLAMHVAKYGAYDGLEVLELRKRQDRIDVVLSLAISDGKAGYLVMCGGDAHERAVVDECIALVKSFRIAK